MRWPFGPPYLTLKTKNKQTNQKANKNEKEETKRTQYQKMSFSVISQFLVLLVGVQNFPFLTTWPKKRVPKKHCKIWVFSNPFFGKQSCITKPPVLDQKTQNQTFQLSFLGAFFFSFNNKRHTNALKPLFSKCFSKPKR